MSTIFDIAMLASALEWSKEDSDIVLRALALRKKRIFPPLYAEAGQFYLGKDDPRGRIKHPMHPVSLKSIERLVLLIEKQNRGVGRWLE